MPVSDAGIAALNKTHQGGEHIQIVDSDPSNPTYGSIVEVFHQLHCLVGLPVSLKLAKRLLTS